MEHSQQLNLGKELNQENFKLQIGSIYEYIDYRKYLTDFYNIKKSSFVGYSYQNFAKRAGLNSPNYLKLVIDGKRNLTPNNIRKFSVGLGLDTGETLYFENLVYFNQAKSREDKEFYFERLEKLADKKSKAFEILEEQYELFSKWYYLTIFEMVRLADFRNDPKWIAKKLKDKITFRQAEEALKLLLKMGLLKITNKGLEQSNLSVSYNNDIRNIAVQKYHTCMIEMAKSILKEDIDKRHVSGLTIAINEGDERLFREKIDEFRRQMSECFVEKVKKEGPDKLVQLNIQLFDLT